MRALLDRLTNPRLSPDLKTAYYYDQSLFVRESVGSVRDAILFGLILSLVIVYFFLKKWGITLTAIVVIPITVLITFVAMKLVGLCFNLMTLGGIAAAIGLVIDDAIVVVESIYTKNVIGLPRIEAIQTATSKIFHPLVGSTLTPVVVFIPLAFLDGITGVFFRALALTMVVALLTSLVLAITLTPSLAAWFIRDHEKRKHGPAPESEEGGGVLLHVLNFYEVAVRSAPAWRKRTVNFCKPRKSCALHTTLRVIPDAPVRASRSLSLSQTLAISSSNSSPTANAKPRKSLPNCGANSRRRCPASSGSFLAS